MNAGPMRRAERGRAPGTTGAQTQLQDFLDYINATKSSRAAPTLAGSCTAQPRCAGIAELNSGYRSPEEVRALLTRLTGKPVDESVVVFPPFCTEFGNNLSLGRDVFINIGCRYQDTGGITIGDASASATEPC